MTTPLCAAELVILDGPDATVFAHSQFCNDVKSLPVATWQWNAWLDAQGRVNRFFAMLRAQPNRLVIWLTLGGAEQMHQQLARYVMRSKLHIEVAAWALHAADTFAPPHSISPHEVVAYKDGYLLAQPGKGRQAWVAPSASAPFDSVALNDWRLADIDAALPWLAPENGGQFVAQALDLERLAAIRFDKGCYPGQEIAARLHFRGGNKRNLRRIRIEGKPPRPGAAIFDVARAPVGKILYSAIRSSDESSALAVLTDILDGAALFTEDDAAVSLSF